MKRFLVSLFGSIFLLGSAHAARVSYDFAGVITSINETVDGVFHGGLSFSSLAGAPLSKGDTFHGQITYDTTLPLTGYQPAAQTTGTYVMYGMYGDLPYDSTVRFDQSGLFFGSGPSYGYSSLNMQVANNASSFNGWDVFYLSMYNASQIISLNLFDSSATAINSSTIPYVLPPLSSFSHRGFSYFKSTGSGNVSVDGRITSLTLTPVPEPETYAMMLAGLGLLGVMTRRRKQKSVA